MATTTEMRNFKETIMGDMPKIFSSTPMPDLKMLGLHLMTKVIPTMAKEGDVAFAWHFRLKNVAVYNQAEYTTETDNYKKNKLTKDDGDTTWFYDWKVGDKTRRCVMTTEIWYPKDKDMPTSPIAYLMGQMFGSGLHVVKCVFQDV